MTGCTRTTTGALVHRLHCTCGADRYELTNEQMTRLQEFTVAWNLSRLHRGLGPVNVQTALTEGLRALAQMVEEGADALELT